MIQAVKSILLVGSTLFPIIDPIAGSPIFLSLTRDYAPETRRLLARRIAVDSFVLLIASFAIGFHVLSFFGISLPVMRAGGGLIVIALGWAMLKRKGENDRGTGDRTYTRADVLRQAFYPLTLPLAVGPAKYRLNEKLNFRDKREVRLHLRVDGVGFRGALVVRPLVDK